MNKLKDAQVYPSKTALPDSLIKQAWKESLVAKIKHTDEVKFSPLDGKKVK